MKEYTKPPLGVAPTYIPASERIADLADAIGRTARGDCTKQLGKISMWAKEILAQVKLIETYIDESGFDSKEGQ